MEQNNKILKKEETSFRFLHRSKSQHFKTQMQSATLKRAKLLNIIKISQYADDTYNNDLRRH